MIDEFAKEYLHNDLKDVRATLVSKLDGLSEYDQRRPMTRTGTNLLGLVKHLTFSEAHYLGSIFGRPFPMATRRWDEEPDGQPEMWATAEESREWIVERYQSACSHADLTIDQLPIDARAHVPWWPRPDVMLFNVMVHVLTETSRHVGHADILREELDGVTDSGEGPGPREMAEDFWGRRRAEIESVARQVAGG